MKNLQNQLLRERDQSAEQCVKNTICIKGKDNMGIGYFYKKKQDNPHTCYICEKEQKWRIALRGRLSTLYYISNVKPCEFVLPFSLRGQASRGQCRKGAEHV